MPSMANITVKKYDGTTDIVYTAMSPSSGDGVAAVWRSESAGSAAGFKPLVSLSSRWNGQKTARRMEISATFPQTATDSTTTITSVVSRFPLTFSIVIPSDMPDTTVQEAVAQLTNILVSSLVRSSLVTGYAPT
jgi:hypothetical protein